MQNFKQLIHLINGLQSEWNIFFQDSININAFLHMIGMNS